MKQAYDFASAQSSSLAAIADAWKSAPFPQNLANVAITTLKTGIIPKAIQAIKPEGFKKGGYSGDYGTDVEVGPVHGKEFVANADVTRKYRPELEAMHNGTFETRGNTNINVNVTVNSNGQSSVESQAQIGKSLGNAIKTAVQTELRRETRQGGLLARRA